MAFFTSSLGGKKAGGENRKQVARLFLFDVKGSKKILATMDFKIDFGKNYQFDF